MILESAIGLAGCYVLYRRVNKDSIQARKDKNVVKQKWKILMDSLGAKAENKIEQEYELLEIIPKHYGWDAKVSIPPSKSPKDFRDLISKVQVVYGASVIAEPSKNHKSMYMRVHLNGKDISNKDKIKFNWYKIFNSTRNSFGETFRIDNMNPIKHPVRDDMEVGFTISVNTPHELSFTKLKETEETLSKTFGKSIVKWNDKTNIAEVEVITNPLSDSEKFVPMKPPTPYEFYLAMTYGYKPVFTNLSKNPHILITGQTQTGKTVCLLTGITNTCYFYDDDDILLFESMISAKQDLRIFAELKQCKYYASNIEKSLRMFRYIRKQLFERNKLFATSKKFCGSIYSWNTMYPKDKLPIILMVIDEMTLYAPMKSDSDSIKAIKQECEDIIKQLIIEGASVGINVLFSLQRPDKESFNPHLKSQVGTRCGFYQGNQASSLVAMDDTTCSTLSMKREAIIKYSEGAELVKTLYLTHDMIQSLLKDKTMPDRKHHFNIDKDGNIKIEQPKETIGNNSKNDKNNQKTDEKQEKFGNLGRK